MDKTHLREKIIELINTMDDQDLKLASLLIKNMVNQNPDVLNKVKYRVGNEKEYTRKGQLAAFGMEGNRWYAVITNDRGIREHVQPGMFIIA